MAWTPTLSLTVCGNTTTNLRSTGPRRTGCPMHMIATLHYLTERHQSAFAVLKNGGMQCAGKVKDLTPEALATAARAHAGGGGVAALAANTSVPNVVRGALNLMQTAIADVVGTDGHRRLCRHEGDACMALFGYP